MPDTSLIPTTDRSRHVLWRNLAEVAALFLRLGATAFGGPAAYIAMMRHEVVARRRWVDDQHFLDLLGATNLIPGPNASEMAMHLGFVRAGWMGLVAGGASFVLPAMVITLGLAWAYVEYGATPAAGWLLYGVKPVIIPLIVVALWGLGREAVKGPLTGIIGCLTIMLHFAGINFVILLVGGGLAVMLAQNRSRLRQLGRARAILPPLIGAGLPAAAGAFSLGAMFLSFVKIGLLMYGSGYVLFAFLHAELVEGHGWLTEQQLVDAIAAGQMTPGPLSSSATFIGYVLGGVPGALLATLGLHLPAFGLVSASNPLIPRLRHSPWAGGLLDGVNVAALGLMAAVTWQLARAAFPDLFTVLIALIAAGLLLGYRVNSAYLVIFGAAMGLLSAVV